MHRSLAASIAFATACGLAAAFAGTPRAAHAARGDAPAAPDAPQVVVPAGRTCTVLVQATSRNDETLDRIREKAREKIAASGHYTLVTDPRQADVTIETNSVVVKGRPGGTAMSAMMLAGQRSNLNMQVLLSSFVAIFSNGQEDAGGAAILAALDKAVVTYGPDLCPKP
ncbi:MAG: hypothetical protein ACKO2K_06650 [Alphaproteobacteria bacterium]